LFAALAYFVSVAQASAEDEKAMAIAKQNACLGCHAINKKLLVQAFKRLQKNIRAMQKLKRF